MSRSGRGSRELGRGEALAHAHVRLGARVQSVGKIADLALGEKNPTIEEAQMRIVGPGGQNTLQRLAHDGETHAAAREFVDASRARARCRGSHGGPTRTSAAA